MEIQKAITDQQGCLLFKEAQFQHLRAIDHQHVYWRQHSKEFWLKDGSQNTSFFHNAIFRRRQVNNV